MTAPRQILPGTTYLVTRRCSQRQFLLQPGGTTNGVFGYVLAVAAHRFGVLVHAYCVLSNHFHIIVTDTGARLPAFEQYLDSLVARALNASLGRWESFWAPRSNGAVVLVAPDDIVAKTAYVLANPVAAGVVRRGREWTGLWSSPERMGTRGMDFPRPRPFFRPDGCMPKVARLELAIPPGFSSADDFRVQVSASLAALEERAGRRSVRRPRTWGRAGREHPAAPAVREPRRALNPRVAAQDKWNRIAALERLVAFLTSYRSAWSARRAGDREAVFPAGTYLLRVMHGVPCAASP